MTASYKGVPANGIRLASGPTGRQWAAAATSWALHLLIILAALRAGYVAAGNGGIITLTISSAIVIGFAALIIRSGLRLYAQSFWLDGVTVRQRRLSGDRCYDLSRASSVEARYAFWPWTRPGEVLDVRMPGSRRPVIIRLRGNTLPGWFALTELAGALDRARPHDHAASVAAAGLRAAAANPYRLPSPPVVPPSGTEPGAAAAADLEGHNSDE